MRSLFYAKSVSAMIASHSTRTRFWISSSNHSYEAAIKREAVSDFPFLAPTRGFEPPTYRLGVRMERCCGVMGNAMKSAPVLAFSRVESPSRTIP